MERQFIIANEKKLKVKEYLYNLFENAGIGSIDIQRTPFGTNVVISARRPGLIIGKRGTTIRELTDKLRDEIGLDNPQIEVKEEENPDLNPQIIANSIAAALERGVHFRRAAYTAIRRVMEAGALGCEITISGKLTGERARTEKFFTGYIKHCGEPAEKYVKKGFAEALPKPGKIGVQVKILPSDIHLPDDIIVRDEEEVKKIIIEEAKHEEEKKEKTREEKLEEILKKNAKDAAKAIYNSDLTAEDINILIEKEKKGKNRKTVLDALKRKRP